MTLSIDYILFFIIGGLIGSLIIRLIRQRRKKRISILVEAGHGFKPRDVITTGTDESYKIVKIKNKKAKHNTLIVIETK